MGFIVQWGMQTNHLILCVNATGGWGALRALGHTQGRHWAEGQGREGFLEEGKSKLRTRRMRKVPEGRTWGQAQGEWYSWLRKARGGTWALDNCQGCEALRSMHKGGAARGKVEGAEVGPCPGPALPAPGSWLYSEGQEALWSGA